MKNIEITEENYNLYEKLYLIKEKGYTDNKCFTLVSIVFGIIISLFIIGPGVLISYLAQISILPETIGLISGVIYTIFGCALGLIVAPQLIAKKISKMTLKKFEKENPEFNINIDIKELENKLKEYGLNQNSGYSIKEIREKEKQEQEHLSFYNNDFKKMTIEEKISFLESEKEFWSQYKENNTEDEKGKQKKKEF